MNPELMQAIAQILQKDPGAMIGRGISYASQLGGLGGALFSDKGIEPGGAALTGAGLGAGAGIAAARGMDAIDGLRKNAEFMDTGRVPWNLKMGVNPKRMALMTALGMAGYGGAGYGVGKLFEDK